MPLLSCCYLSDSCMTFLDYAVLVGYFALMASIGLICMWRVKGQEDYFMGGRGFGKLLQTFAAFGAGTGSSDPANTGRTTFVSGLSGMWSVMYWLFVTPFYWIAAIWYRRMRLTTFGDWYTERYESRYLGAAYAVFGIYFILIYSSMMFSAVGKVAAPMIGSSTVMVGAQAVGIEYLLIPAIGVVVLIYGLAGGIQAAYWTDLIQGLCIVLLSVLLIPYGLWALVEKFGDPETMGMIDGFRIMHEQIPTEYFAVVGSSGKSEFPLHFLIAVVIINLITAMIQPHFITTGGGSAKDEFSARCGVVFGNFLKRFCTLGWVLTALIALALFADSPELAQDPDKTWGVASRELLGPGLTGLMLACLLAALMSSIDVYMIVGSALVVKNVYLPFIRPDASDKQCLRIARWTGVFIVAGSVIVSLMMMDLFEQLKLTWVTLVPVAAPFWVGMYWRRATTAAAWSTIAFCTLAFFIAPWLAPMLQPGLRDNPALTQVTPRVETTITRLVAPTDVARRSAAIQIWDASSQDEQAEESSHGSPREPRPEPLTVGDSLSETTISGGKAVYWSGPVVPFDEQGNPLPDAKPSHVIEDVQVNEQTHRIVRQYDPSLTLQATGNFRADLLVYRLLGMDISKYSDTALQTLGLPPKIVLPFLVMILVSFVTPANSKEALDRYYVKMKTPVLGDPESDAAELEESYRNPHRFDDRKLWPNSNLEFQKPTRVDLIGFGLSVLACFGIIALAIFITGIGG